MRQRHSGAHLFWRTVLASGSNVAMTTGIYPMIPHAAAMIRRWRMGDRGFVAHPIAAAAEWAMSVAVSTTRPLGFFAYPTRQTGARPVILLHGYAMNCANFLLLTGSEGGFRGKLT